MTACPPIDRYGRKKDRSKRFARQRGAPARSSALVFMRADTLPKV